MANYSGDKEIYITDTHTSIAIDMFATTVIIYVVRNMFAVAGIADLNR